MKNNIAKVLKIDPKELDISITWPEGPSNAELLKREKSALKSKKK